MSENSQRKTRFTFNLGKDIFLLKTLIQVNPWEFGDSLWEEVVKHFETRSWKVTERSLKDRLRGLQKAYKLQTLPKTGTEEEKTERATLLEEIEKIVDAAEVQKLLVIQHGAEDTEDILDQCEDSSAEGSGDLEEIATTEKVDSTNKKVLLNERKAADTVRDAALKSLVQVNTPPEPASFRRKRIRLTEEELMERRQDHDMYMDMKKIELEESKERRLKEEGERRDEIAKMQLEIQKDHVEQQKLFMGILSKVMEK